MVSRRTSSLPDRIYLIDSEGYYYSFKDGRVNLDKTFPDESCEVTVEYLSSNPDEFYLRTCKGGYFQYHHQKKKKTHIDHKPTKHFPKRPIVFTLLDLEDKDTFVFRSSEGKFMILEVNEKRRLSLGGFEYARIKVGDPAIKKQITDLVYDMNSSLSTITELPPEIAVKTTVRNDSEVKIDQALKYHYLVSHLGSWTNAIGASIPQKAIGGGKIPSLVDGQIIAVENYSHVEMFSGVETKEATSTVAIPAKTKGVAAVLIYKAKIQVPFTYTEEIWYQSGKVVRQTKEGFYSNKVTFGVDVELTDLVSITHVFQQYQ